MERYLLIESNAEAIEYHMGETIEECVYEVLNSYIGPMTKDSLADDILEFIDTDVMLEIVDLTTEDGYISTPHLVNCLKFVANDEHSHEDIGYLIDEMYKYVSEMNKSVEKSNISKENKRRIRL